MSTEDGEIDILSEIPIASCVSMLKFTSTHVWSAVRHPDTGIWYDLDGLSRRPARTQPSLRGCMGAIFIFDSKAGVISSDQSSSKDIGNVPEPLQPFPSLSPLALLLTAPSSSHDSACGSCEENDQARDPREQEAARVDDPRETLSSKPSCPVDGQDIHQDSTLHDDARPSGPCAKNAKMPEAAPQKHGALVARDVAAAAAVAAAKDKCRPKKKPAAPRRRRQGDPLSSPLAQAPAPV
jgi:hypothetical protein